MQLSETSVRVEKNRSFSAIDISRTSWYHLSAALLRPCGPSQSPLRRLVMLALLIDNVLLQVLYKLTLPLNSTRRAL